MKRYILALDEGTTSTRSILFDRNGKIVAKAQKELTQFYPVSGWVEEDAVEIYAAQYATMTEAVVASGISPDEIAAIGITNQRETTVVWNKMTDVRSVPPSYGSAAERQTSARNCVRMDSPIPSRPPPDFRSTPTSRERRSNGSSTT